jgi:hypothetical protein
VLALVEGLVSDALQQFGVVRQALGVAPGDLVWAVAEVVVAERLEASKHRVDLGLLGDEGGERLLSRLAIWFCNLGLIFVIRIGDLDEPMNASFSWIIKRRSRSESAA